jgi:hypothetical protein
MREDPACAHSVQAFLYEAAVYLKVHKIENCFGSDFEFCVISLLVMLKYYAFVKNIFGSGHYWGRCNFSA